MHCTQCGAVIEERANFCTSCGAKVEQPIQAVSCPSSTGEWRDQASTTTAAAPSAVVYAHTDQTTTLSLIAFILALLSTISLFWLIIPLAWMIPMTVHTWGIYKGKKPNTTAFGVCTLIFLNLIGGILLLVADKD